MAAFLFLSAVTVVSAAAVIAARHPIHSIVFTMVTFFHMAGLYVLLGAEFLAVINVLVYSGAIMVLFLFVVMILQLRAIPGIPQFHRGQTFVAPLIGVLFLAELGYVLFLGVSSGRTDIFSPETVQRMGGNVAVLGTFLYREQLLPFEIASLILLVAAVGAIVLARKETEGPSLRRQ
jgi:NADH-quinone oxidoreductase subunit J